MQMEISLAASAQKPTVNCLTSTAVTPAIIAVFDRISNLMNAQVADATAHRSDSIVIVATEIALNIISGAFCIFF